MIEVLNRKGAESGLGWGKNYKEVPNPHLQNSFQDFLNMFYMEAQLNFDILDCTYVAKGIFRFGLISSWIVI